MYGVQEINFYLNDEVSPHITFKAGNKYKFLQGDSTNANHPLKIFNNSQRNSCWWNSIYQGVTISGNNGTPGSYVEIAVTETTPVLYYYCVVHPGMGDKQFFDANGEDLKNIILNNFLSCVIIYYG